MDGSSTSVFSVLIDRGYLLGVFPSTAWEMPGIEPGTFSIQSLHSPTELLHLCSGEGAFTTRHENQIYG